MVTEDGHDILYPRIRVPPNPPNPRTPLSPTDWAKLYALYWQQLINPTLRLSLTKTMTRTGTDVYHRVFSKPKFLKPCGTIFCASFFFFS